MHGRAIACSPGTSGPASGYERRRPEDTRLYRVVAACWPTFRARAEDASGLPGFVVDEVEGYLRCGILEHGVAHLACRRCGHAMVVGFSYKGRGFCPSCTGRRMADLAAHLVDEVLPKVAIRQWVCSLPWRLRVPLAYDRALCADVLGAFVGALQRSLRWRAKRTLMLAHERNQRFVDEHIVLDASDELVLERPTLEISASHGKITQLAWGRSSVDSTCRNTDG